MRHAADLPATPNRGAAAPSASASGAGAPAYVLPSRPGGSGSRGLHAGIWRGAAAASAFSPGDESAFPNRVHGRVFFSYPGQGDFSCSGTAVAAPSRSLVISAGHCAHEMGEWATNWMFVPGYRDGSAPYGEWAATALDAPAPWVQSENDSFDVSAATIARNADGRALEDVVGARGIGFNQPRRQVYTSYGYPAGPPQFDGERLFACTSPWQEDDSGTDPPRTMGIKCDMNQGASGGGWVSRGLVLSVNSYCIGLLVTCVGDILYGPYFGDAAEQLYRDAAGRTVRCDGLAATQVGSGAPDHLAGTGGRDAISLAGGADSASGKRGADRICGGRGADALHGGPGHDVCVGGPGHDTATGCEVRRGIP